MAHETSTKRRQRRVSYHAKRVAGEGRLRLTVSRSNDHIYAQIIDDARGVTVASASTVDKAIRTSLAGATGIKAATVVGEALGQRAQKAGVKDVFFDRGSFRYHGRVKALAEAARAAGLNF